MKKSLLALALTSLIASTNAASTVIKPVSATGDGTIQTTYYHLFGAPSDLLDVDGITDPYNLPDLTSTTYTDGFRWNLGSWTQLTFDLGGIEDVNSIILYNYVEAAQSGRSLKTATIQYSTNGIDFFGTQTASFEKASAPYTGELVLLDTALEDVTHIRLTNFVIHGDEGANNMVGFQEIRFAQVPEPSSVTLLGLSTLALLTRRRR